MGSSWDPDGILTGSFLPRRKAILPAIYSSFHPDYDSFLGDLFGDLNAFRF